MHIIEFFCSKVIVKKYYGIICLTHRNEKNAKKMKRFKKNFQELCFFKTIHCREISHALVLRKLCIFKSTKSLQIKYNLFFLIIKHKEIYIKLKVIL